MVFELFVLIPLFNGVMVLKNVIQVTLLSYKHRQSQTRRHCECLYLICIATGDLFMYILRTGYDESLFSIGFKSTVSQKIYYNPIPIDT